MNVGIKAKPPDPLNSTHEKDLVRRHPWNLVRGLTHLPLPFPHPFLNTSHLLKNTIKKKKSNHSKSKKMRGNYQGNQRLASLPSNSQAFLHLPLLRVWLTRLRGFGEMYQTFLGRMSQGRRLEEESEARRRQAGQKRRERTPAKVKGRRCREGMKERWAALGRPDTGNRPGGG